MTMALAKSESGGEIQRSAAEVVSMTRLVGDILNNVMKKDQHYGIIPGCGDKPALLKSGAEKLCVTFRLAAVPEVTWSDLGNGHRDCRVLCKMIHIPTGEVWGVGVGSCSTMESKYRWRGGARVCPECGKATIKKSKYPPRGAAPGTPPGFYCFAKIGGCGAEFAAGDKAIADQSEAKTENPDLADQYNTVLKMAKKRALVDGTLTATGASDLFTQDVDELAETEDRLAPPSRDDPGADDHRRAVADEFSALMTEWTRMDGQDFTDACMAVARRCGVSTSGEPSPTAYAKMIALVRQKMAGKVDFVAFTNDKDEPSKVQQFAAKRKTT